jgi:hypothetical protein
MAGLVAATHVFVSVNLDKTWMPGTRPGMTKLPGLEERIAKAAARTLARR